MPKMRKSAAIKANPRALLIFNYFEDLFKDPEVFISEYINLLDRAIGARKRADRDFVFSHNDF